MANIANKPHIFFTGLVYRSTNDFCMSKNQHVVPHNGKWGVRGEGNSRCTSVHETKREATAAARQIARNQHSELLIHNLDGRISQRDSHGHDPFPPKG